MLSTIYVGNLFTVTSGNIHGCKEKISSCDILSSVTLYNYFLTHDINLSFHISPGS